MKRKTITKLPIIIPVSFIDFLDFFGRRKEYIVPIGINMNENNKYSFIKSTPIEPKIIEMLLVITTTICWVFNEYLAIASSSIISCTVWPETAKNNNARRKKPSSNEIKGDERLAIVFTIK